MKKIIIIMLVLMTVGIVCANDSYFRVNNRSGRNLTIALINNGGTPQGETYTFPGSCVNLHGSSGITYDIIAVVGDNIDIRIPGYYEIQKHTLEWWGSPNNIINFYFSHLDPVKPGDPGQNQ